MMEWDGKTCIYCKDGDIMVDPELVGYYWCYDCQKEVFLKTTVWAVE